MLNRLGLLNPVPARVPSRSDAVKHLLWLRERMAPDLVDAAVVMTGPVAYRRPDGVGVIPAAPPGP